MSYGRLATSVLKSVPGGGAAAAALGALKGIPGLSGVFGGLSRSQKRLKSRARLDKLLAKSAAGTISARGLRRLERKAKGPYAKQAAKASAALGRARAVVGARTATQGRSGSGSLNAGPMSLAFARVARTPAQRATRTAARTTRKVKRTAARSQRAAKRAVRVGRMPPGLRRYWQKVNARRRR